MNNNNESLKNTQFSPKLKCSQNQQSKSACINQSCTNYTFVCSSTQCKCRSQHQNCILIQLQGLHKTILSKSISLKPVIQLIDKKIQQTINQLSDLRDKLINFINSQILFYGFTNGQTEFMEAIKNGEGKQIIGKKVYDLFWNVKKSNVYEQVVFELEDQINKELSKLNEENVVKFKNVISKVQEFKEKISNNPGSLLNNQILIGSEVIRVQKYLKNVCNFFQTKIKSTKLLYRASQHNFQVSKFYQKCSRIPNTLVILQNQFGKILGGFTPLKWQRTNMLQWVHDESRSSFIFSVTDNKKFTPKNYSNTQDRIGIQRYSTDSYGPVFGGQVNSTGHSNFYICDNSNQKSGSAFVDNSATYFNKDYYEQNYNQNKWFSLIGNPKGNSFKTTQWQVWQIQFKN